MAKCVFRWIATRVLLLFIARGMVWHIWAARLRFALTRKVGRHILFMLETIKEFVR